VWLSRLFDWRSALTVVTPRTFIGWHRKGFQFFWRRKCQSGRPRIPPELQQLIRQMARENLLWGEEAHCQRITAETWPARVVAHDPQVFAQGTRRSSRPLSPRSALVHLSQESRRYDHRLRFLRRSDRHFSDALRARGYGTCFTSNSSPQRDCASDRGLDPSTAARGRSVRPHLRFYHP